MTTLGQLHSDVAYRAIMDAFLTGTAAYWERRARELENARPRRGDFHGRATDSDLAARHRRLTEAAAACRARATLMDLTVVDLADTLDDVAAPVVDAEHQLRAAIDAGDTVEIERLSRQVDRADLAEVA